MTNGFRDLLVGGGEPIYVKLKEVEKLAVRHFKGIGVHEGKCAGCVHLPFFRPPPLTVGLPKSAAVGKKSRGE